MVDLTVRLPGLSLPSPVFVGAGPNTKTAELALEALRAGAGAVEVTGPAVSRPDGNWIRMDEFQVLPSKEAAFRGRFYSLASTGAARRWPTDRYSADYQLEQIRRIREGSEGLGAVMVSIGSVHAKEAAWAELARLSADAGAQAIVLHLQTGQSLAGRILMEDPDFLRRTVTTVKSACAVPVIAKIPIEGCDPVFLARVASEAGADAVAPTARYVGLSIDIDTESVPDWQSFHGYGGPWALPITAAWTAHIARARVGIPTLSGGGVASWRDIVRLLLAGATMVQVCTWTILGGYGVLNPGLERVGRWMADRGYERLDDFRGKLLPDLSESAHMWARTLEEGPHQGLSLDGEICTGCGACVHVCFFSAISLGENRKARIDEDRCAGCGCCYHICPADAITSPLASR